MNRGAGHEFSTSARIPTACAATNRACMRRHGRARHEGETHLQGCCCLLIFSQWRGGRASKHFIVVALGVQLLWLPFPCLYISRATSCLPGMLLCQASLRRHSCGCMSPPICIPKAAGVLLSHSNRFWNRGRLCLLPICARRGCCCPLDLLCPAQEQHGISCDALVLLNLCRGRDSVLNAS
jgi:hypothetical protein